MTELLARPLMPGRLEDQPRGISPGARMRCRRIAPAQELWLAIPSKDGACFAAASCRLTTAGHCRPAAPPFPPALTCARVVVPAA